MYIQEVFVMEANTSYTDAGYDMYNDIKHRTNGEIYLGVVGPVRTGKSTFIRRFTVSYTHLTLPTKLEV